MTIAPDFTHAVDPVKLEKLGEVAVKVGCRRARIW